MGNMLIIKGQKYCTIVDAAKALGVSSKTVRNYIEKGIIPKPPEVMYGLRRLNHFPQDYIENAKRLLAQYPRKKGS